MPLITLLCVQYNKVISGIKLDFILQLQCDNINMDFRGVCRYDERWKTLHL